MRRDWVNVRILGLLGLALVVGACGSSSKSTPPPTPSSFGLLATVQLPNLPSGKPAIVASFDISWFDNFEGNQNVWFTDAGNNAVDQINTANNTFAQYINLGGFGGNNSPTDHDCNGPNGAVTAIGANNSFHELWVGDIAKPTPCGTGTPQIWAFDLTKTPPTPNFGGPIALNCVPGATLLSGDPSNAALNPVACPSAGAQIERADELSYDATDDLILIAVPHPAPGLVSAANPAGCATAVGQNCGPWVNIVAAGSGKVLAQIVFPQATNGIEQSQWDAKTDTFYLNLPYDSDLGNDANGNPIGAVAKIKVNSVAVSPPSLTISVPTTPTAPYSTIVSCSANGLSTINPANRNMLLGCANSVTPNSNFAAPFPTTGSATNLAEVMNADTGLVVAVPLTGVQSDEVWYDSFNNIYYESGLPGGAVQLGATNATTNAVVASFLMAHTPPPHSVTADSVNGHVIMPGPLNNDTWDNSSTLTFPTGAQSPGNFSCTKGCVWVFGLSPNNSYPVE